MAYPYSALICPLLVLLQHCNLDRDLLITQAMLRGHTTLSRFVLQPTSLAFIPTQCLSLLAFKSLPLQHLLLYIPRISIFPTPLKEAWPRYPSFVRRGASAKWRVLVSPQTPYLYGVSWVSWVFFSCARNLIPGKIPPDTNGPYPSNLRASMRVPLQPLSYLLSAP